MHEYPHPYLRRGPDDVSTTAPEVTIDELSRALGSGATLIDVREPAEYAQGHVPGARLIPMGQLPSRLGELDRSTRVYVVCASGGRSSTMVDVLTAAGFDAVSVADGTAGWQRQGRPVVRGEGARA